eukprot:10136679-Alexandrium_andersonii.AAC.1
MSASLVGSEMCIRDRFRAVSRPSQAALRPFQAALTPRVRAVSRCFRPVSYTHLTLPTICSV